MEATRAPRASARPVVIVTGASSGIGLVLASLLRRRGDEVVAVARRSERMEALRVAGVHVRAVDVTDDAALVALTDEVRATFGRIDGLVNNAGYGSYGALEEVPLDEARRQLEVNLLALARLTQLVLPQMRAQRRGTIVNVSSVGGRIAFPFGGWYHATKFAVEGLSDALRVEVAPFGIRVVLVEPGSVCTEWGAIAGEALRRCSGEGPYRARAERMADIVTRTSDARGGATPPERIARVIARALASRHPRRRYLLGRGAKAFVLARRFVPAGLLDRVISLPLRAGARRN